MSLFPDWSGLITLPSIRFEATKIGGNTVHHKMFRGACINVTVSDSEYPGHDIILTQLSYPFNHLLLRRRGARRISTGHLVLSAPSINGWDDLTESTELIWEDVDLLFEYGSTPDKVLASWKNKFLFKQEEPEHGTKGLRIPQIGALHAISAHFSVGSEFEPATVVLPTGTGKRRPCCQCKSTADFLERL